MPSGEKHGAQALERGIKSLLRTIHSPDRCGAVEDELPNGWRATRVKTFSSCQQHNSVPTSWTFIRGGQ
nr:hypothetical protein DO63_5608 [Burkholderia pseudomallei]